MTNVRTVFGGLLAWASLSFAATARADLTEMPPNVGNFWFNESVKSAQRKCETFNATYFNGTKKVYQAYCLNEGVDYLLTFSRNSKLNSVSFAIDAHTYADCAKKVLDAIGAKGRSEDKDGYEIWAIAFHDERHIETGWMMCSQRESGADVVWGLP